MASLPPNWEILRSDRGPEGVMVTVKVPTDESLGRLFEPEVELMALALFFERTKPPRGKGYGAWAEAGLDVRMAFRRDAYEMMVEIVGPQEA